MTKSTGSRLAIVELGRECKQTCDVGNAVCASGACRTFSTPLSVNGNEYGFCD